MKTTQELLNELARMAEALTSAETKGVESFHAAAGICKEAGELLGLEDKAIFQGHPADPFKISEEIGDLMFYLLRYLEKNHIPFRECLVAVIAKLRCRYPGMKFDRACSIHRNKPAEKQAMLDAVRRDRSEVARG